uniref:Uncharacterized protein n=1 Tax=Leersia perrieri TaxID=77586 RepID=A0A0D9VWK8_9ORYZ
MVTYLDGIINPARYLPWNGSFGWLGYHGLLSTNDARNFSAENAIHGSSWIPATGIPYTPGL